MPRDLTDDEKATLHSWSGAVSDEQEEALAARVDALGSVMLAAHERLDQVIQDLLGEPLEQSLEGHARWKAEANVKFLQTKLDKLERILAGETPTTAAGVALLERSLGGATPVSYELEAPRGH